MPPDAKRYMQVAPCSENSASPLQNSQRMQPEYSRDVENIQINNKFTSFFIFFVFLTTSFKLEQNDVWGKWILT
jgi:hypothetical protein